MENVVNKQIDKLTSQLAKSNNMLAEKNISKAGYDKTLIGFVSEKIEREDGSYRWRIQTNGTAYDVAPEMCNITEVGQRVRLYIPNHSFKDKYAEVIDNSDCTDIKITKDNIKFSYDDGSIENVTLTRNEQGQITSFTYFGKTMTVNRE